MPAANARENRLESGHVLLEEIPALAAQFAKFPTPAQIVISNVAGTRVRSTMIRVLEVWPDAPPPHWLIPQEEQCGVVNRYRNPAQLGSDRWAALIGARAAARRQARAGRRLRHRDDDRFPDRRRRIQGRRDPAGRRADAARAAPAHRRAARRRRRIRRKSDADRRRDRQRLPARAGRRDRAALSHARGARRRGWSA